MQEEKFDTFEDMRDCYQMDAGDIKEEVSFYLREVDDTADEIICMSDDGSDVYIGDDFITYRKFSAM